MNSVDAPQYALVQALVEKRQTNIDDFSKYVFPDFAVYRHKMYLDREPGFSFLTLPFYLISKALIPFKVPPYGMYNHEGITTESPQEALTYGLASSLSALGIVFFFLIVKNLGASPLASLLSAFSLGIGTLIWKYASGYVRQPVLITFMLSLLYLYMKIKKRKRRLYYFLYGFLLGLLIITDHLSIFVVFVYGSLLLIELRNMSFLTPLAFGGIIPIILFLTYNLISFGNPLTSPRTYTTLKGASNPANILIADLRYSIPLNLLSFRPIPKEAFSYFKNHLDIEETFKSPNYWATVWTYKGIFIQSPFLFLGILGIILHRKYNGLLFLVLFLAYFIPASKIVVFYAPTAYDTRYVLPAIPFIAVGLPFYIDFFRKKSKVVLMLAFFILLITLCISTFNSLQSTLTHFAPHVTGEHRFSFEQLHQPIFAIQNLKENFWLLFVNTFPNIYNIHLLFLFYFPLCFIIYLLIFQRKFIISVFSKHKK